MTEEQSIEKETLNNQPEQKNTDSQTDDEKNWKAFRDERKKEREQLHEAQKEAHQRKEEAKALKSAMDSLLDKPKNSSSTDYDDDHDSEEKRIQREVERILSERDKKNASAEEERRKHEVPVRLRQDYNDFDKIVTTENLDYLEFKYPEVANALKHTPEGYDKWKNAYQAVKRFVPSAGQDPKKAEDNLAKPRSMASGVASTGDSAPVQVDDKRKADNWKRMQKIIRGS